MHRPSYAFGRAMVRFVSGMYVRHQVIHRQRLRRPGAFVLACTHIGHLEPLILGASMERAVHWVAREEFFRVRAVSFALSKVGVIKVDRRGVPVSMFRQSIARLRHGEIVGIFPEGGRTHGNAQAVRGGVIKGGAAVIALRAGVPIVPVVMLGTDRLQQIAPWIPGQRTTVRTIVGRPIFPTIGFQRCNRRRVRKSLTAELAAAFVRLHGELVKTAAAES